jgi:hypothetical protein
VTGIVNLFSGSAKQNKLKPRQYKYAAERNFLDDSFTFEERSDSMWLLTTLTMKTLTRLIYNAN